MTERKHTIRRKNGEVVKDISKLVLPPELAKEIFEMLNPHRKAI